MVKLKELFDAVIHRVIYGPKRTNEETELREQNKEIWAENEELSNEIGELREELEQKTVLLQLFDGVLTKQYVALDAIRDLTIDAISGVKPDLHQDFRRKIACPVGEKLPRWAESLRFINDDTASSEIAKVIAEQKSPVEIASNWYGHGYIAKDESVEQ